jgi:heterodisulfide reductase subunit A
VEVCEDNAIHFDVPLDTVHERQVGAVILAPGFQVQDGTAFNELGFGSHPDILMSAELQRLLESPGPTGGYASKPSNEEYPESVLLVLDNLSQFGLYIVASQAHQLLEQDVESVSVLVLSQLTGESEYEEVQELAQKTGVQVRWGAMLKIDPTAENTLDVSFEDFSTKKYVSQTYDMVVLCSDVEAPDGLKELTETADIELADNGYISVSTANGTGVATSQPGIFVAGCASGAKNIKDSIADAHSAAGCALEQLDPRMLDADAVPEQAIGKTAAATQVSPDDMRSQIEQLLYALISRTDN